MNLEKEYTDKIYELYVIDKTINRANASKKIEVREQRTKDVIKIYNDIIKITKKVLQESDEEFKQKVISKLEFVRGRLKQCLQVLEREDINVPNELTKVEYTNKTNINNENNNNKTDNMALTKIDFFNLCARTITHTYNGDPIELAPFLKSIELLQSLDENNQFTEVLKNFILTKLQGVAMEAMPANPVTIQIITDSLKEKIKPENSKVVSGKLMAIKADRTNFTDYTKKTEDLSEQFKRSLVLEGIPEPKANEMTIDKTIELCRANTNSNIVKSVLSSSKFKDAKEVIAKFIIESRVENTEQQILAFRTNRNNNNGFYRNKNQSYNKRGRGNYRPNYNNQNNDYYKNNRNSSNYNNNNYNNNYKKRDNKQNNWNNKNNNWRNNNNNRYNGSRGNRVYYAENGTAPPPGDNQEVQLRQAEHQYD